MSLYHRVPPLDAEKQPGEIEFTPLELTRLRWTAINFQNLVVAGIALVLVAGLLSVGSLWADQRHRAHDQCVSANHGRAEIKQAFGDLYDGFIAASSGDKRAVDFKAAGMNKLDRGLPQRDC